MYKFVRILMLVMLVAPMSSATINAGNNNLVNLDASEIKASKKSIMTFDEGIKAIENPKYINKDTHWTGENVFYGLKDGVPISWNILDKDNNDYGSNSIFLTTSEAFDKGKFGVTKYYEGSILQEYNNSAYANWFSEIEKSSVMSSNKGDIAEDTNFGKEAYENPGITDEFLFPLSLEELTNSKFGFGKAPLDSSRYPTSIFGTAQYWTRSPETGFGFGHTVAMSSSYKDLPGHSWASVVSQPSTFNQPGSRLGMNLKKDQIMFVTAAENGKVTTDNKLTEVEDYLGTQYKLTLRDNSQILKANLTPATNGFNVTYSAQGNANYLSGVVVNELNEVLYYGKLKDITTEKEGTLKVDMPIEMENLTLKLFTEQDNGNFRTDYISNYENANIEKTSSVSFDSNDGVGNMPSVTVTTGDVLTLPDNTFTKDNNTFVGWNTAVDGSGVSYSNNSQITVEKDVVLYAQWSPNIYTVAFSPNNGVGNMSSLSVNQGDTIVLPNSEFTYKNYTFTGWNNKADGSGQSYKVGDIFNPNDITRVFQGDILLYAQWELTLVDILPSEPTIPLIPLDPSIDVVDPALPVDPTLPVNPTGPTTDVTKPVQPELELENTGVLSNMVFYSIGIVIVGVLYFTRNKRAKS